MKPIRMAGALLFAITISLGAAGPVSGQTAIGRVGFEIEGGPVWQGSNDVEIPNDGTATRFSLSDLAGSGPYASYRFYLSYAPGERHRLRLLLAPFSIEESGISPLPIRFENREFAGGEPLRAKYRFSSYRLTYSYRLHAGERWLFDLGFTAKIRDAEVALSQNGRSASNSNVGFVPLIHVRTQVPVSTPFSIVLDADFLAAPQGRAEDISLKLRYSLSDLWYAAAGYRMLEGGADVDDVYTFAWLHYAVLSFGREF